MNKPVTPALPKLASAQSAEEQSESRNALNRRIDELTNIVESGFKRQDANLELLIREVKGHSGRIYEIEHRVARASERVRGESQTNLGQDKAISEILLEVQRLKETNVTQLALLERVESRASKIMANPIVRSISTMLGTAILTWLASKGVAVQ